MINNINKIQTTPTFKGAKPLIMLTQTKVPGAEITEHLGLVTSSIVGSRNILKEIWANFKSLIGGELRVRTKLIIDLQQKALSRLEKSAQKLGADGVANIRFIEVGRKSPLPGESYFFNISPEKMMAYGTAVKIKPLSNVK